MASPSVITLDLNFQGRPHAIAAYLIRHRGWRGTHRKRTRLDSPRAGSWTRERRLISPRPDSRPAHAHSS